MARLVIVVPLREGVRADVEELLREGPPVEVPDLERYVASLTDAEAVLTVEGPDVGPEDGRPWGATSAWRDATRWERCAAGPPRIGRCVHAWEQTPELEGVFFGPEPGPGDSEGGEPLGAGGVPPAS